jgi:hypothetical protein
VAEPAVAIPTIQSIFIIATAGYGKKNMSGDRQPAKHVDSFLISGITKNNENRKLLDLFTADSFLYSDLQQKYTTH